MIYWLLSAFFGVLVLIAAPVRHEAQVQGQTQESDLNQRAIQTLRYMNALNDWRYDHPGQPDGVIPDSALGWASVPQLQNRVINRRTWVYQPDQPGLMAALLTQTRRSALLGKVSQQRLTDSQGNDMQVSVPPAIPDGSLVYLN